MCNFPHVYPEDLFYKVHKVSRKDFLKKLEDIAEQEKDSNIMNLFEDPS